MDDDLVALVRAFAAEWDRDDDTSSDLYLSQSTWDAMNALRRAAGVGPAPGSLPVRRSV